MPYNQEIVGKFERSQLPVGHGGFHIGTLNIRGKFFRYFFDCGGGSAGKAVITEEFERTEFNFGVVSHFDYDHFSQLRHAKVKRIFIPYLDETDLFFLTLAQFAAGGVVVDLAAELADFAKKVQVVMVRHSPEGNSQEDVVLGSEPDGAEIGMFGIPAERLGNISSISDSESINIGIKNKKIVKFKFYNHRAPELRSIFEAKLNEALTEAVVAATSPKRTTTKAKKAVSAPVPIPALSNVNDEPYKTVEAFLADLKLDPAVVIHKNAPRLKAVYGDILKDRGEAGVTASNLSSLVMFSATNSWCDRHSPYNDLFSKPQSMMSYRSKQDGWMLTGDLELTGSIWAGFYNHYNLEIEQCIVFNVPHHGSAKAFDDDAIHNIKTKEKLFIFPVKYGDKFHPAPSLNVLLTKYGVDDSHLVMVTEQKESRFTLTHLYYRDI